MHMSGSKPKVFEDIYDSMASIRETLAYQDANLMQQVETMQHRISDMKVVVDECSRLTQFLNEKSDSFDCLMSEQRVQIANINTRLVEELTHTRNEVD